MLIKADPIRRMEKQKLFENYYTLIMDENMNPGDWLQLFDHFSAV